MNPLINFVLAVILAAVSGWSFARGDYAWAAVDAVLAAGNLAVFIVVFCQPRGRV